MTNYLSKFIPQYSDMTGPLRQLIHHDVEWHWHDVHEAAFNKLKGALTNPPVLQFFGSSRPVVISADASQLDWTRRSVPSTRKVSGIRITCPHTH